MTIRIVDREVNPLIATKWYLKKMIQELPLVKKRGDDLKDLNLPSDFIKRQTTDIIADCIRRVQALYSWEKNSYTGIVYREIHFNNELNNVLQSGYPLTKIKKTVTEISTIEHVIPVSHFKDKIFKLLQENKIENSEIEIVKAFLSPVALIDKKHTNKDNENNINKGFNIEEKYPFRRYKNAEIKIVTHDGFEIDNENWTIEEHWELLKRTEHFKNIISYFGI